MLTRILRVGLLGIAIIAATTATTFAGYETKIIEFCKAKVGRQVGSGECAHLATEALRYADAEFLRTGMADFPASGDYVWGTFVKEMKKTSSGRVTDSHPSNKCLIGDIIQYRLGAGKTHHTAIVAAVNSSGYPTWIYQQNYNSQRFVSKDSTDLHTKLKDRGGYLRIYRAKKTVPGKNVQFTLVNNAKTSSLTFKVNGTTRTIGAKNASNGFSTWSTTATSPKIIVGGREYTIQARKGYEFYQSNGVTKLRMLAM